MKRAVVAAFISVMGPAAGAPETAHDPVSILKSVARDIESLKGEFPQLADFSAARHVSIEPAKIVYGFRTHAPERRGGWTSGVPHPDDDGVWFYIDIHDPASTLQIHAQPATAPICLGDQRVSFLILEGKNTKRLDAPIWKALATHGAKPCGR